ncbi:uncharacterized protein LOC124407421 [Diprion similis]|uniref:uncharacterized protein LOC124407421 n=1 Tax=Diprion similis TaxID=362088 RepID=UPI001EF99BB3|nr:uncharacterized protein LOC124407421 [Diprion similis]
MIGPNLQKDLFDILLRFRAHEFVLTADIAAMFQQILHQRRTWPFAVYVNLLVVAAEDAEFPQAAEALNRDFYMDDVLTGTDTIEKAIALRQILQRGQFNLRKWRSNDDKILESISQNREVDPLLTIDQEGALKTLGILWDAKFDVLKYKVFIDESPRRTKRVVLSTIAQIFDPPGLLAPVLVNAKSIMQRMWQLPIGWDESLPQDLQASWEQYYGSFSKINDMHISRNINPKNYEVRFDLIGFSDASERAYGACIYAVSRDSQGIMNSHLISSKSQVALLKTISLPKLELNAALLLAKLCNTAKAAFGDKIRNIALWSDSTIVLSWIATSPNMCKTYVANRVTQIQDLTREASWLHVPSQDNPADLISRGMSVEEWMQSKQWWHGPAWLTTGEWPKRREIDMDTSEMKVAAVLAVTRMTCDALKDFSSFDKMQRQVPKGSKLAPLSPYLDDDGVIRVGGRLSRANISETKKHPIILPDRHHVTKILLKREHQRLLHCGSEQLLHSIRQRYWVLNGRRESQKVTRSWVECYRRNPKSLEVTMGDLPQERVRGSLKPFTNNAVAIHALAPGLLR